MDSLDIIHAAQGKAMNTYDERDAMEVIRAHIDRAYNLAEVVIPPAVDYEQIVSEVTQKIMKSYSFLTSQEIALVAEAGVAGELTTKTRPSAAAFFGWLSAYMGSEIRKDAIRSYRRRNSGDESVSLSLSQIEELNRSAEVRAIRTLWKEYKENGRILDDHLDGYVAMAMDGAIRRGLFKIGEEHWKIARDLARKDYRRRSGFRDVFSMMNYTPEFRAKRHLLEMCFNGQKGSGVDLVVNS